MTAEANGQHIRAADPPAPDEERRQRWADLAQTEEGRRYLESLLDVRRESLAALRQEMAEVGEIIGYLEGPSVAADDLVEWSDLGELPPPPEWLVDGLIYRQGVYLFVGEPKSGKTTAMRSLAATMATGGGGFLGRKASSGRVAYLDFENPPRLWAHKFDELLHGQAQPRLVTLKLDRERGSQPLEQARAAAGLDGMDLVFVDGLAALTAGRGQAPSSDGGYGDFSTFMGGLRDIASRHDVAIVCQHHAPWSDRARALGSVALTGQVDGIVTFLRMDGGYWISADVLRDGDALYVKASLKTDGHIEAQVLDAGRIAEILAEEARGDKDRRKPAKARPSGGEGDPDAGAY